jgi:hypothetical protein
MTREDSRVNESFGSTRIGNAKAGQRVSSWTSAFGKSAPCEASVP